MKDAVSARWAISFADLLLLLLGCFVFLHAIEAARPTASAGSAGTAPDASAGRVPAAELDAFKSFWTNKEAEGLVEKFISNTDESTRKAEWKKIQELFNEEMPSLNVMDFPLINAHQSTVCGTKANGMGVDQLQETWISGS